jgi:hypothetical protein
MSQLPLVFVKMLLLNHPKAVSKPAAMLQQQSHESDASSTKGISDKSPVRTTIIITVINKKHQNTTINAPSSNLRCPPCSRQQYATAPLVACMRMLELLHTNHISHKCHQAYRIHPGCCACSCRCTCKASRPECGIAVSHAAAPAMHRKNT